MDSTIVVWWDRKIKCCICNGSSSLLNRLQICNDCGGFSHNDCGGCCDYCSKTLCGRCTVLQKSRLSREVFCADCFNGSIS